MTEKSEHNKEDIDKRREHDSSDEKTKLREASQEETHPTRSCVHRLFHIVGLVTTFTATLMGAGQLAAVIIEDLGPIQKAVRCYMVLLCVLVVMNETEFFSLTRESKLLRIWVLRGLFYTFIGVLGINECAASIGAVMEGYSDKRDGFIQSTYIVSCFMIGTGVLYIAMGILCLQLLYNKMEDDYQDQVERAKEIRRSDGGYGGIV